MAMPDGAPTLTQDLPPEVAWVLDNFVGQARQALGPDLDAVVLYGSAAEAALRPTSDVNVLLVLGAFDRNTRAPVNPRRTASHRGHAERASSSAFTRLTPHA